MRRSIAILVGVVAALVLLGLAMLIKAQPQLYQAPALLLQNGTVAQLPGPCVRPQVFFASDVPVGSGQNLYFCDMTGTPGHWTQMALNPRVNHLTGGGGIPVITVHFNTSGDSIAGSDLDGVVTVGSGTATSRGTVSFAHSWTNAPVCLVQNLLTAPGAAKLQGVTAIPTTTALTFEGFAFATGVETNFTNGELLSWHCVGS